MAASEPSPEADPRVAFVIAVRNPLDSKVHDPAGLYALLDRTVTSLLRQTHVNVRVIVVSHGALPPGIRDERAVCLDVSGAPVFRPDAHDVRMNKGLRYAIGSVYALNVCRADFVMPMDADDYVHVDLAAQVGRLGGRLDRHDGLLIERGVHVQLSVDACHRVSYHQAFLVDRFHMTCGSCRVVRASAMRRVLTRLDPNVEERLSSWRRIDDARVVIASDAVAWLETRALQSADHRECIDVLGRHVRQEAHFSFLASTLLGAAKGCGHQNHDGPRQGAIHYDKVRGSLEISTFRGMFGLHDG